MALLVPHEGVSLIRQGLGGSALLPSAFTIVASGGMALGAQQGGVDLGYHVYANTGSGDAINYSICLATVTGPSWTSPALSVPCHFKMGVRAFDPAIGLEEQNVDAVVELILDSNGNDVPSPL